MKVSVDHNVCTGHGLCYLHAPTVFTDDDDGYGQVIGDGVVSAEDAESTRVAAANCPERAITVED
jgi:ferredoxin